MDQKGRKWGMMMMTLKSRRRSLQNDCHWLLMSEWALRVVIPATSRDETSLLDIFMVVLCSYHAYWLISVYYYTNICTSKWCKINIRTGTGSGYPDTHRRFLFAPDQRTTHHTHTHTRARARTHTHTRAHTHTHTHTTPHTHTTHTHHTHTHIHTHI